MNRHPLLSLLALALLGAAGLAQATETALHNDMDGDGKSDLIWRNASTGAIMFWSAANAGLSKTVGVDNLAYNVPAGFDLRHMQCLLSYSDAMYNPRRNVLLVRDPATGADYSLFPYHANFNYSAYESPGSSEWLAVGSGDFNGDSIADVVYRNQRDGRNQIILEASWADWSESYPLSTLSDLAWKVAGIGDFDGDGRSDILWRNPATGQNSIWRSANGSTKLQVATLGVDWRLAAIGHFDADGRSDLFWRNTHTGADVIWKAANSLTSQTLYTVTDQGWQVVAAGDFNGDRKWDVVWRYASTGQNVLWKSANRDTRQTLGTLAAPWNAVM